MSAYTPPTGIYGVYNSLKFYNNDLDNFLEYPVAQGDETLKNIVVNGTSTFNELMTTNNFVNFNNTLVGSLTSEATQPPSNDNSKKIPTTAWVQSAIGTGGTTSTLSQVLQTGNSAGLTSINMNNNDITNVKDFEVDGSADFNSTVNIDGVLTIPNIINMTGATPALSNIQTREYRFKDVNTGITNSSIIYSTGGNTLSIESYPTGINLDSFIRFYVRNTANIDIQALRITPTECDLSVPLDLDGGSSALSRVRSRVYGFRDITSGSVLSSSIYYQSSGMILDCNTPNSSVGILTKDGSGNTVSSLSVQSSQITSNVAIDMISTGSFFGAMVRSRYFNLRDITSSAITSAGIYYGSNILQIDSSDGTTTPSATYLRTTNTAGSLVNSLKLTYTDITTDCPQPAINDNSTKIPTTAWVQSVLSSYIPPTPPTPSNMIRRASSAGNFTGTGAPNQIFQIQISLSGGSFLVPPPTNGWLQNEGVTFRVNYFQSFTPRGTSPFDSQNYISSSSILTIYPFRFNTLGWLSTVVSNGPRGRVSDNVIVTSDGNSNTNYVVLDSVCTAGRQFWASDASFQSNGSFLGRLFIYGSSTNINNVNFELSKPSGYSAGNQVYSYNFSVELLNQSNTFSTITSSSFNISNL
jgi:hypothetical protein